MAEAPAPVRLVVHAGFHKTGTTTAQRLLHTNRVLLNRRVILVLRSRLTPVLRAARGYSTWRDPVSLAKVSHRLDGFLATLAPRPGRTICLACEELSGHLPGRGALADYSAAPALMAEIAAVASARYAPPVEIRYLFTTRAPRPWLKSAWAEHVKSSHMQLDFDAFAARYADAARLDSMVDRIRAAVAPWPVAAVRLEDTADLTFGPAAPLLDLLALPDRLRRQLVPEPARNRALPDAILAECLAINRATDDPETARARKDALLGRR